MKKKKMTSVQVQVLKEGKYKALDVQNFCFSWFYYRRKGKKVKVLKEKNPKKVHGCCFDLEVSSKSAIEGSEKRIVPRVQIRSGRERIRKKSWKRRDGDF